MAPFKLTRRRVALGAAMGLAGLALVPLVVTRVENRQADETAGLLPYEGGHGSTAQRSAVVFFSRSGSTALLARHLARRMNGRLYRIDATDYDLGLAGWVNAMRDARTHEAVISPQTIDLSAHDVVYLGSPIWLYSPAPPIWQFVERNRFDGQRVVLFNTFNSRFEPETVAAFRQKVLQRGARSFEHQFIRRGRMGGQLSPQDMLAAFDAAWAPQAAA
jgi:flavodoxin